MHNNHNCTKYFAGKLGFICTRYMASFLWLTKLSSKEEELEGPLLAFECCNPVFEWLFYLPIAAVEDVAMDMREMLPGAVSAAFA